MSQKIACNPMVYRQTATSRYTHSGSWEQLVNLVERHFGHAIPVNPQGTVMKVEVPAEGFFTSVVAVTPATVLKATFGTRPRGLEGWEERPFVHVVATSGSKSPARHVDVILYHVSALTLEERTLKSGSETQVVDAEWQIVSVNGRATDGDEPPNPVAMARDVAALNMPEGVGGTARIYTAEEFLAAILHWQGRVLFDPEA